MNPAVHDAGRAFQVGWGDVLHFDAVVRLEELEAKPGGIGWTATEAPVVVVSVTDRAAHAVWFAGFDFEVKLETRRTGLGARQLVGVARVTVGGRVSEIRFAADGGVAIDYDDDGTPDLVASNCRSAPLAQCTL